jgi:hypothetical protein
MSSEEPGGPRNSFNRLGAPGSLAVLGATIRSRCENFPDFASFLPFGG